jgi:DNA mismatch repair protein MutS
MTSAEPQDLTPLMKQYWDLKNQVPDTLLLFRMGDFYELFGDDAVEASRLLELTLTTREKNKANPIPMAGVPHHAVQTYVQRLLRAGRKVAIGEQMEDPSKVVGKAIVRRELTRIFTPGVQFDLEGAEANYLAAAVPTSAGPPACWVLSCLDVSTGEALLSEQLSTEELVAELLSRPIRQLLRPAGSPPLPLKELPTHLLVEELPANTLSLSRAEEILKRQYGVESLAAFVTEPGAILALGTVVSYSLRTQRKERLLHLRPPVPLHRPHSLRLGPRSAQHLDLVPTPDGAPNLFDLINRTRTALGARQLRRWIQAPLREPGDIRLRQDSVRELASSGSALIDRVSAGLSEVYDLERLCGRVNTRLVQPRETLAIGRSLAAVPSLASRLSAFHTPTLERLRERLAGLLAELGPLGERIVREQLEEAPLVSRDGGIFGPGVNPELDRLVSLATNGQSWLVELEARERASTGIPTLKVRYNRVFGYYIEITSTHLKSVPAHYQRKQTTVGAERFFTDELKKFEEEILSASARQRALELELFEALVAELEAKTRPIMDLAGALAELDALVSLSRLAAEPGWCFPTVDDSLGIEIRQGRHPLVDHASRGRFVPNDLVLDGDKSRALTITGPNMGGKSTVMRQEIGRAHV